MMAEIERMWINQPSTHQADYALHGTLVLAEREDATTWRAWFLEWSIVSRQFLLSALSPGWPAHLRGKK